MRYSRSSTEGGVTTVIASGVADGGRVIQIVFSTQSALGPSGSAGDQHTCPQESRVALASLDRGVEVRRGILRCPEVLRGHMGSGGHAGLLPKGLAAWLHCVKWRTSSVCHRRLCLAAAPHGETASLMLASAPHSAGSDHPVILESWGLGVRGDGEFAGKENGHEGGLDSAERFLTVLLSIHDRVTGVKHAANCILFFDRGNS